jgi:hypothetical protein
MGSEAFPAEVDAGSARETRFKEAFPSKVEPGLMKETRQEEM